jgi:hypothetical protein
MPEKSRFFVFLRLALCLQRPAVARWYEGMRYENGSGEAPAGGELFADVSHEVGNLVHKMYYWAAILEEDGADPQSAEVAGHMRESLGELHGLVSRTMDLLRPVKARPILISLEDLCLSLCARFGLSTDSCTEALAQLGGRQTLVDPLQVDRAVGMLVEAFARRCGVNSEADTLLLTLQSSLTSKDPVDCIETAEIRCEAKFDVLVDERDAVAGAVGAALAQRLLEVVGWKISIDDQPSLRTLTILVPLSATADARNGSPDSDTCERQARLNA